MALVGSRRLSSELGDLAESVNRSGKRPLSFDYLMDANGHPVNIYCRSDHYEYARTHYDISSRGVTPIPPGDRRGSTSTTTADAGDAVRRDLARLGTGHGGGRQAEAGSKGAVRPRTATAKNGMRVVSVSVVSGHTSDLCGFRSKTTDCAVNPRSKVGSLPEAGTLRTDNCIRSCVVALRWERSSVDSPVDRVRLGWAEIPTSVYGLAHIALTNQAFQSVRPSTAPVALFAALTLLVGCSRGESARTGKVDNPQTWAPEKLTSVQGVPATEIEALIQKKLDGPKLDRIDDDQWGHTRRLYQLYGRIRLAPATGSTRRAQALTMQFSQPTLMSCADDYPIGALRSHRRMKQTKTPPLSTRDAT